MNGEHPLIVDSMRLVAELFGVQPVTVANVWIPAGMPREEIRNRKYKYDLRQIVTWRLARLEKPGSEDLMSGESSPALERYRAARADMSEMQAEQMRQNLVDLSEVVDGLLPFAGLIRQAAERLERKYDPEARRIVEEAIEEFEAHLQQTTDDDSGETTNPPS